MCDCIKTSNEQMKAHNAALVVTLFSDPQRCIIETYQIVSGRGQKRAPKMLASFCPFCGVKYASEKDTPKDPLSEHEVNSVRGKGDANHGVT